MSAVSVSKVPKVLRKIFIAKFFCTSSMVFSDHGYDNLDQVVCFNEPLQSTSKSKFDIFSFTKARFRCRVYVDCKFIFRKLRLVCFLSILVLTRRYGLSKMQSIFQNYSQLLVNSRLINLTFQITFCCAGPSRLSDLCPTQLNPNFIFRWPKSTCLRTGYDEGKL